MLDYVKNKKKFTWFLFFIVLTNLLIVINYYDGFFLSDEFNFFLSFEEGINVFTDTSWEYYRPIPLGYLNIMYQLFGLNPIPYHLFSILMNSINTILYLLLTLKLFKSEFASYFATILYISFYGLYFEVFFWIAAIFDIFMVFFLLCSLHMFINYYRNNKYNTLYFYITGIFVLLAFLSKETAIAIVPVFVAFDYFKIKDIKSFLKKSWKYIIYIPIPIIFISLRMSGQTTPSYRIIIWIILLVLIGVLCIPLFLKLKKINDPTGVLVYLLAFFSTIILILNFIGRFLNFAAIGISSAVSYKYFKNFDTSLKEGLYKAFRYKIDGKMNKSLILMVSFISFSSIYYGIANYSYYVASTSTYNISNKIIDDNPVNKTIYIINIPYFPLTWSLQEVHLEWSIKLLSGEVFEINHLIFNDANRYKSEWHLFYGAELISPSQYDILTQNSSNQIYLYDINILSIRNISYIPYSDLF
ncbi:MAG: ArnT family glycosyltransferase [Promethearchaeota archaeon]